MSSFPSISETPAEIHTAGVFLQVRPGHESAVAAGIAALDHAEVHGVAAGKLVVVCQAESSRDILGSIERMRELEAVLNVALVFQHAEDAASMKEEIGHDDDSP